MTYLAGAYSHNPELSFRLHRCVAAEFARAGVMVYSPIVYGHSTAPNAPYHYWITHGMLMLAKCDRLHLLDAPELPAHASRGVKMELEQATLYKAVQTQQYIANVDQYIKSADLAMPA